jgi:hemerythrin-like metal-binding protein
VFRRYSADMANMAIATTTTNVIFPWKDSYSVGIPEIDAQHKGLIRLINELHAAMSTGQGKQILGKTLDDLVQYTEIHFSFEEGIMRRKAYSELTSHHAVHVKLTGEVIELRNKFHSDKLTMSIEVMQFLRDWLAGHIMVHDQAYAREFQGER